MSKHHVRLSSEAGEALARDAARIPWDVYPRPHMERDSYFSLNGWWRLSVKPRRGEGWTCRIRVPFAPQALLSGVEREVPHDATLIYECDFTFPALPDNGDRILLVALYDNLGKGASGAALECLNLVLGMERDFGLSV